MEPSKKQKITREEIERRRKKAKNQQIMLWILCGVLIVILVFLLVGILELLNSEELNESPRLKGSDTSSTQSTPGTSATSSTTEPITKPTEPEPVPDTVAPVIHNAVNREFWLGDKIVYAGKHTRETDKGKVEYQKVTASDDVELDPNGLTVDYDAVNTEVAGTYPVIYTATDMAGNVTTVTVNFTLVERPEGYIDPEDVYAMAQEVLDKITTEDMSDMEVAFAIYQWTKTNIGYINSSDKSSWTAAAHQAFTHRSGDCYNYFAAAKALFTVAGIENVDVVKSDTTHSSHFWSLINLGDGWYHVDCTPRRKVGYFFMNTDAELEAYSVENKNSHIFDGSLYPERATESVQDLVDYANGKIKK